MTSHTLVPPPPLLLCCVPRRRMLPTTNRLSSRVRTRMSDMMTLHTNVQPLCTTQTEPPCTRLSHEARVACSREAAKSTSSQLSSTSFVWSLIFRASKKQQSDSMARMFFLRTTSSMARMLPIRITSLLVSMFSRLIRPTRRPRQILRGSRWRPKVTNDEMRAISIFS